MIITRENNKPVKSNDLTDSVKLGNAKHIIAMRNASDRAFEQIAIRMGRSWKQKKNRKSKRKY